MAKVNIKGTNAQILNAIHDGASDSYRSLVPRAIEGDRQSLLAVQNALQYTPTKNEFIGSLYNVIGQIFITNTRKWNSPLKKFKRNNLMFGDTIEEVAINLFKEHTFVAQADPDNPGTAFKQEIPDAMSLFHTVNRKSFYEATVNENEMMMAMLNENGLSSFVAATMTQLYNSDEAGEYNYMVQIFRDNYLAGNMKTVETTAPTTQETAKDLIVKIRTLAQKMTFYKQDYNVSGIATFTPMDELHLFIRPELQAYVDVEVLAVAFNMDKADFIGKITVIDDFGAGMENVLAIIGDKDMLVVCDKVYESNAIYDPRHLSMNNYLHHWEVLSFSTFVNCVALTTPQSSAVTAITLDPASATIAKGSTKQFTPTVTGDTTNATSYILVGNKDVGTNVSATGLVTVSAEETATSMTLHAFATNNIEVKTEATITVS